MFIIEMFFPAGRFHATPWGRNVNEGVPEWPPSPFRLLRAIYDVWKRKFPEWPVERVEPILAALAFLPPRFNLPPTSASHLRTYVSENNKGDVSKKQKVFDAFVAVDPAYRVLGGWNGVNLSSDEGRDLDQLLRAMNYLGRSESWVSACLAREPVGVEWNCFPVESEDWLDSSEIVRVACPVSRQAFPPLLGSWLNGLAWSTKDLLESRRSDPPALRYVDYWRATDCFNVSPRLRQVNRPEVYGVLYGIHSSVPVHITATVELAERVRRKLIGLHRAVMGGDGTHVSPKFSGKDREGEPLQGHRHAYILPLDQDMDGWLDHIMVVCREPFSVGEQTALDRLSSVWQLGGRPDLRLLPVSWGGVDKLFPPVKKIRSLTPFVAPRHYRKGRGPFLDWLVEEVKREANNHYLPCPVRVNIIWELKGHGARDIRWTEFRRSRHDDERPRSGYGFEIEFAEDVAMPVALGYCSYCGLGMFGPTDEIR